MRIFTRVYSKTTKILVDIYETCNMAMLEPEGYGEALKKEVWVKEMEEEIKMIEKNNTWKLIDCPHRKDIIRVKWVYKTKLNPNGAIQKHKARLVVKGYSQQLGIDYNETFALVARLDMVRSLIAHVAQKGWSIYKIVVKFTLLNRVRKEEIYIDQPQGFISKGNKGKVKLPKHGTTKLMSNAPIKDSEGVRVSQYYT
ncbi:hypothetical protein CR513_28841, partial [Mucuna pruriens]